MSDRPQSDPQTDSLTTLAEAERDTALAPLLSAGSRLDSCSVEWWTDTRGAVPRDLWPLDDVGPDELAAIEAAGGRCIDPATPVIAPVNGRPGPSNAGPRVAVGNR